MTITYGLIGSEPYDSRKALINGRVYSQFLVACYARLSALSFGFASM